MSEDSVEESGWESILLVNRCGWSPGSVRRVSEWAIPFLVSIFCFPFPFQVSISISVSIFLFPFPVSICPPWWIAWE